MTSSTSRRGAAKWALLSLAIGSFGIGMTEFVVMGLLPNIARELVPTVWAASPDDAILDFAQSAYGAAAELGNWDRSLERPKNEWP